MKYIRKMAALLLTLIMMLNLGVSAFAVEGDPSITLTADKTTVTVDEEVTITIGTDSTIANVYGIGMKLHADSSVFEVVSISTNYTSNNKLAEKGWIKLATMGTGNNLTVSGIIATVVLKAKAAVDASSIYLDELECTISGASGDDKYVSVNTPPALTTIVTAEPPYTGYTAYLSDDTTTIKDDTSVVQIFANYSNGSEDINYSSYDVTVSYDPDKLSFDEASGYSVTTGDTVELYHDSEAGTIRIAGVGDAKDFNVPIAALTFTMNTTGTAQVALTEAKISNQQQAIQDDALDAKVEGGNDGTPGSAQIKVPFTVEQPDYVISDDIALEGGSYSFTLEDVEFYDYGTVTVTMGEEELTLTPDADGVYTISNVTGDIEINVTQTPKRFDVTFVENADVTFNGGDQATYGEPYIFSVTAKDGYLLKSVAATMGSEPLNISIEDGQYVISGDQIRGDITITVTAEPVPDNSTVITVTGVAADKVQGGLTHVATNSQPYTITLLKEDGILYTAKIGDRTLAAVVDQETGNTQVTIPGEMITGTALTVVVTKVSTDLSDLTLEVNQYIQLDEQAMFLITASHDDAVLAYDGTPMFWSEKYNAYCWLVISTEEMNTAEAVTVAAQTAITLTNEPAAQLVYSNDINLSGTVDINDAQLVYDMYTATYPDFTTTVTMEKFLKADVAGDEKIVDTVDAAAIVSDIVGNTTAQ